MVSNFTFFCATAIVELIACVDETYIYLQKTALNEALLINLKEKRNLNGMILKEFTFVLCSYKPLFIGIIHKVFEMKKIAVDFICPWDAH